MKKTFNTTTLTSLKKRFSLFAFLPMLVFLFGAVGCSTINEDPLDEMSALASEKVELPTEFCGEGKTYGLLTNNYGHPMVIGEATIRNTETDIVIDLTCFSEFGFQAVELGTGYKKSTDGGVPETAILSDEATTRSYEIAVASGEFQIIIPKPADANEQFFSLGMRLMVDHGAGEPQTMINAYIPGMKGADAQVFQHWLDACGTGASDVDASPL